MTTIPLPSSRGMQRYATGLLLLIVCLVFLCQIAWPWRAAAAVLSMLSGVWLWRRYLQRRPVSLTIEMGGVIRCMLADGQGLEVARMLIGIIRPGLLCARLEGRAGEYCDLLVPGGSLSESAHWQLRRALIRFRPAQPDDWRGT